MRLRVHESFTLTGRGTVVTATVEEGVINTGDTIDLIIDGKSHIVESLGVSGMTVKGIETFSGRKDVGEKIGVLLGDQIAKEQINDAEEVIIRCIRRQCKWCGEQIELRGGNWMLVTPFDITPHFIDPDQVNWLKQHSNWLICRKGDFHDPKPKE